MGRKVFWRGAVLLISAVLLCGCETQRDGLNYAVATQKVGPPKAGHARIVVLREKGYGGIVDGAWDIQLDGTPLIGLKTGTFVFVDRPTGAHQLTATEVFHLHFEVRNRRFLCQLPHAAWHAFRFSKNR